MLEKIRQGRLDFARSRSIVCETRCPGSGQLGAGLTGLFEQRTSPHSFESKLREPAMSANPVPISELQFEVVTSPEEVLVRCSGRINSATSADLQSTVRSVIPETKRVVLDLTDVSYMDSSGLGAVVSVYLSAKRQGCDLRLINLNQRLKELFRLTQLAKIFEGHDDMLGMTPD
jgi:anti-sigma B factor antagonist